MAGIEPSDFLERCQESSQHAYEMLRQLLEDTAAPSGEIAVRRFLTALKLHCEELPLDSDEFIKKYHFNFSALTLDGHNLSHNQLTLLQLPSIFTPEDWSFTFYEGLARYPAGEFDGKTIAELGCGNGWITLALAKKNAPQKIYGLDINPRAVVCARLNLLLNGYDDSGTPIIDADGKSLSGRVEFHTSDLLGHIIENKIQLDRTIGCIPQVLSPEPLLADKLIDEKSDDEFLYSLSNYCEKQGYIEDQFGLGLISRALEEAILVGKPNSKIILNLGGRPGSSVLERLFTRRGFAVKKIWSTKVWQAEDTDIGPLVEIEKTTSHRFEFFTSLSSNEPVCARTAKAYTERGGRISHSLTVYEAALNHPAPVKSIFNLINQSGFEDSRNAIDLSFSEEELADEKLSFVGNLAEWLLQKPFLPYSDTEGEPQLRRQIAQFFRSYWRIPLSAKSIFVGNSRRCIIKNYLHINQPKLTLAGKDIFTLFRKNEPALSQNAGNILEAPLRVDEVCRLVDKLKPDTVVVSLQDFEIKTVDSFLRLSEICKSNSAKLLIDLSQQFELSSQQPTHGVLSYLTEQALPEHVTLLFGLIRNKVYPDLELCFLLSENSDLLDNVTAAAELSYSRTPLLTQKYYSKIFSDLLNFQLSDLRRNQINSLRLPVPSQNPGNRELPTFVSKAFSHPAVTAHKRDSANKIIRMDYGENALPSPPAVHSAIMDSFLRQTLSTQDAGVESAVREFCAKRFDLQDADDSKFLTGNGVAPLFSALLESISENRQKIIIPNGAYGYFAAACGYFNANHVALRTRVQDNFKINVQELEKTLSLSGADWLYLNAPTVNPTGAIYSSSEINEIVEVLRQHKCALILDTIFSGLEFDRNNRSLKFGREPVADFMSKVPAVILGGLSKELACGGLRFGWAFTPDNQTLSSMKSRLTALPHSTVRYAAKKIYQALNDSNHNIHNFLENQRKVLSQRSRRLSDLLNSLGWNVIPPEGGLFLSACPWKYFNIDSKSAEMPDNEAVTALADQVADKLFDATGVLVNNSTWTGLPGFLRFVVSTDEQEFELSLQKLREFDTFWINNPR
ncbi:MAG: aminotransferase class I/II-fold pyridoxal phosphate-dependent enzyme [Proteobacteria bacterium]|nr:aminotransferase class I/II-fold pyridoxal phosphate-dependent enzyme [Pseudomonadota bacterium]